MKKLISIILTLLFAIGLLPVNAEEVNDMDNYKIYVSPAGDDNNAGEADSPLKTLAAARDAARVVEADSVEIVLYGGEYTLGEALLLDERDSNVTWTNFEGEVPVVTSAMPVTNWTLHNAEKNIYKASVDEGFDTRQLYFNGEKAKRSRNISYNGGYGNLLRTCELGLNSRNNKELYFYRNEVDNWSNFEDVEVHLLTAWTDNLLRLKKYDAQNNFREVSINNGAEGVALAAAIKVQDIESERIFNRAHPDITGSTRGYASRSYYYFENAYEFIDEDTEWYLDKSANTLYFKAPKGADMNAALITAPRLETLVKIEGSADNMVNNVTFKNIVFECTTWTRPNEEGIVGGQGGQNVVTCNLDNEVTVYRPTSAFEAIYANRLLVCGCTFRNIGATALDFYYGVTNSQIFENEVYNVAGNGISVAKFTQDEQTEFHEAYNPSDKTEICKNIDVINNSVHDIGTEYEGAVGIIAGYPENIVIAHNDLYNMPYSGISVGFGWTDKDNAMKNNIILANKIYDIGKVLCDFGAIYTLSKQPASVCARNYIYNVGRQAWFDYGYAAMYFDEQTAGYTITHNLMCNIGSDAWGGGINFNGCANKNTTKDNYINVSVNANEITTAVAQEAGVVAGADCNELAKDAEAYLFDIVNPKEPYDETDYFIYSEFAPVRATATAQDAQSSAEYAIDKNDNTVYTLSNQTAASMGNEYLLLELDGKTVVDRIVIDRQFNAGGQTSDNTYWADWCLAVGCELQGSVDGETWETVGVMNTWPDGTGEMDKDVYNIENPKAYKYIRYIRTKYKQGSDYAVWKFSTDGGNRLNVKEITFFTKAPALSLDVVNISATICDEGSRAEYATDNNPATAFTLSNQTASSIANEYLLIELKGTRLVEKIIIRRQFNACGDTENTYWADWCLAVGCEIQGSMDGQNWDTLGVMNTWPDGTGDKTKEIFEIENPKEYKYIRYIRTKYKQGSDYAVWKFSTDGGNRLNVKDIELYTSQALEISSVVREGNAVKVKIENSDGIDASLCIASYKDETLLAVTTLKMDNETEEYEADVPADAKTIKAMILDLRVVKPLCGEIEITEEFE